MSLLMKLRRPRFSLRTLVVTVLVLGMCWTLTATWGISGFIERFPAEFNPVRTGNSVHVAWTDFDGQKAECTYTGTAIFPFLVRVDTNGEWKATPGTSDVDTQYSISATYFWFFGYVKALKYQQGIKPK